MRRIIPMTSLVCALLAWSGCPDDKPSATTGDKLVNLSLEKGRLFRLELNSVKLDKVLGGKEAKREFKHFINHNKILLYTHETLKHVLRLGVTAPAASYGESSYKRVRVRSDHIYVRVPAHLLRLVKDDGTIFEVNVASMRLKPKRGSVEDGVIDGEFNAEVSGSFGITHGDTRFSGDFFGEWTAIPDNQPPEVTVVPPARGLVSGAFDVYFDEPVTAKDIQDRVFLRNKEGKKMKIRVQIRPTDIDNYTTHLRVETNDLLPFNERLTLAVGVGFEDLVGNTLAKPEVTVINTKDYPPLMNQVGHDFDKARDAKPEFRLQGEAELVDSHLGKIKPVRGRFLKLIPPRSGSRYSSALVTRLRVPADAEYLQVRVLKTARTRDTPTPCLRYVMAHIDGLLWNVECGPTDLPKSKIETPDGEYFTTPWVHLNIRVDGQRGREVLVVLEARPLDPKTPLGMDPVFLVDMVRTVWVGEDPRKIDGDLELE